MAGEQAHTPGDAVSVGVLFGHREGRGGDVRSQEAHVGQADRQADDDAAAARADVGDGDRRGARTGPGQCLLHERLRLRPGDHDSGGDPEVEAVELPAAQDVGQGLASLASGQEALQRRRLCRGQRGLRAGQEVGALQAQDVAHQDVGLQVGLLHTRVPQPLPDVDQGSACVGGACGHSHSFGAGASQGQLAATASSSLRACSAAARASTRPSRSPSRTSGRLWAVKPMRWSVTRLWGKL